VRALPLRASVQRNVSRIHDDHRKPHRQRQIGEWESHLLSAAKRGYAPVVVSRNVGAARRAPSP